MERNIKVYQAINKVQAALSKEGISKVRKNTQQGYQFRGIDDVYNVLSPLLAEHGLCILPRVLTRECVERQSGQGKPIFYVAVEVEFDFVCAEDGSQHTIKTFGEAMDSADKATNKAMSAAYKYAAFQAFAIPTEGDNDADGAHHDIAGGDGCKQPNQRQTKKSAEASALEAVLFAAGLDEAWLIKQASAAGWEGAKLAAIAADKDWLGWANDLINQNRKAA